jgi:AraC-like DNA-binding protein
MHRQEAGALLRPRCHLPRREGILISTSGPTRHKTWEQPTVVDGFVYSVREAILVLLRATRLDVGTIAEGLGVGARTLQRRLRRAGVDFTHLVADVRFEIAVRLLGNPRMKLTEIALEVGYSDQAHFSRAFRQWTGVPPREFRRRVRSGAALSGP